MEAVTAEEGLALVKLHHFDLVLMDIQLPGMNGIEALACLRADEGTRDIPVVAVTASVTMQDQSQITRAGFDAFISKPISVKEFVETVNSFVGKPA
jgi:two-component system cell cycle response regulator DivK